jgi:MFS family permease
VHGWIVYGVQVTLVPLSVVEVLARPPSWSGSALTLSAAGTALTLVLGGRMADEKGRAVSVRTGLTITVVGTLGLGFTTALPAFLGASLLVGVGAGLTYPATHATVGDVLSTRSPAGGHGAALAGFQMVGDIGAILGPLLAGLAADAVGYAAAFALTATVAAASLGCWGRAGDAPPRTRLINAPAG